MKRLEFQLVMQTHTIMNEEAKQQLLSGDQLPSLEHSVQKKFPQAVTARGSLAVRLEQTAIFITDDWVISIYGRNFLRCVSSMLVLTEHIEQQLGEPGRVRLHGLRRGDRDDLDRAVGLDKLKDVSISMVKYGGTLFAGAALGIFLQWLIL